MERGGKSKNPDQLPFTEKDDYEILNQIMNVRGFHLVNGNSIWQSIERKKGGLSVGSRGY